MSSQRDRFVPWFDVFGEQADDSDRIDGINDFVGMLHAYLVSFTTDAPNRIVRNAGEAVLQQVQNPPRCQRVEDLGVALEDWLSKKRQYEMFTDSVWTTLPGIR